MLTRRFTIVCLLLTVFSMFFASLVAQAGRTERGLQRDAYVSCMFDQSPNCGLGR